MIRDNDRYDIYVVEWKFASSPNDYLPIQGSPFLTRKSAEDYPRRNGFRYRIRQYRAIKCDCKDSKCDVCGMEAL